MSHTNWSTVYWSIMIVVVGFIIAWYIQRHSPPSPYIYKTRTGRAGSGLGEHIHDFHYRVKKPKAQYNAELIEYYRRRMMTERNPEKRDYYSGQYRSALARDLEQLLKKKEERKQKGTRA